MFYRFQCFYYSGVKIPMQKVCNKLPQTKGFVNLYETNCYMCASKDCDMVTYKLTNKEYYYMEYKGYYLTLYGWCYKG